MEKVDDIGQGIQELVREPGGQTLTFRGAISNLYHMVGTYLGLKENAVSKPEFSCGCIFCRPEWPDPTIFCTTSVLQKYLCRMTKTEFKVSC